MRCFKETQIQYLAMVLVVTYVFWSLFTPYVQADDGKGENQMSLCQIKEHTNSQNVNMTMKENGSGVQEIDNDFDGINDSIDEDCNRGIFTGNLQMKKQTAKWTYTMNYREFFRSNRIYSQSISVVSCLLSGMAYGCKFNDMNLNQFMEKHGLMNVIEYEIGPEPGTTDDHLSQIHVGHRKVVYKGETKEIIAVVVQGSNASVNEWYSNVDLGDPAEPDKEKDWMIVSNHKGFDIGAVRILRVLADYEKEVKLDPKLPKAYWITGHSRGGAIANILGARLNNQKKEVFVYTFAAPNTTTAANANEYKGIYNMINEDDIVPYLPMNEWGFTHYGKSVRMSIGLKYPTEWNQIVTSVDGSTIEYTYNKDGLGSILADIAKMADNRRDCVAMIQSCQKDAKKNIYQFLFRLVTANGGGNAGLALKLLSIGKRNDPHSIEAYYVLSRHAYHTQFH